MRAFFFFLLLWGGGLLGVLHAQSAIRYPYVEGGNVIVSRDGRGGVKASYLRDVASTPWDETPQHTENNRSSNIVATRFEVATAQPDAAEATYWNQASSYCSQLREGGYSNWRVPTQRELMLIYVMDAEGQLAEPYRLYDTDPRPNPPDPDLAVFYWSATLENGSSVRVWTLGCSANNIKKEGKVEPYDGTTVLNYVRCVRDVVE